MSYKNPTSDELIADKPRRPSRAVDFDKTLAYYESKWKARKVGPAIPEMVDQVKKWLAQGDKVTIFTARISQLYDPDEARINDVAAQIDMIRTFCKENGLPELPITAVKKKEFTHFYDDKAFHVIPNKGRIIEGQLLISSDGEDVVVKI